jgi:glycerol uptake facilitator-like aquaporin
MFDLPLLQLSQHAREGGGQVLSEVVASFGLIAVILGCRRFRPTLVPGAVALYVVAGYWFTASTCFANPAVAIARSLTDSFAGIRPVDVPWFVGAEIAGAIVGALLFRWLLGEARESVEAPAATPKRLAK